MARILVAEDHGLYRFGLRLALEAALPDIEIFEADSMGAALIELSADPAKDVALFDLRMPGLVSFDMLRATREQFKSTRMVILSASTVREDILGIIAVGFDGFISKLQSNSEIIQAIRDVLDGKIYLTPLLSDHNAFPINPSHTSKPVEKTVDLSTLTPRQRQILPLLARGLSNKEIARSLNIAEATTKIHIAALLRTLGARNRIEAAMLAKPLDGGGGSPNRCSLDQSGHGGVMSTGGAGNPYRNAPVSGR